MKCDFFRITRAPLKNGLDMVYPEFIVGNRIKDLMVRGGSFYAVLNQQTGMWETNEGMVQTFVDEELDREYVRLNEDPEKKVLYVKKDMASFGTGSWTKYKKYVTSLPDNYHQLDNKICFCDTPVTAKDYVSKRLDYPLKEGPYESWDELVGTLYQPEEREKIEWAIGSIISGDSKYIQKFVVLYGDPGAGKGTIIEIIKKLFPGYYEVFDAKSLSNNSNAFAFEQFRTNPLIALQSDGDLSKIEDNTKINSLVSHETVVMNEKRKQSYNFTPRCFLFMASNKPVKITDAKSGIIRRLIDVHPSGNTLPKAKYDQLMGKIEYELSGIAWHCLEVFKKLGKNYYNGYRPLDMMYKTDTFFNFMKDNYDFFNDEHPDGIGLTEAFKQYEMYVAENELQYKLTKINFRNALQDYYEKFSDRVSVRGEDKRSWFRGFRTERFKSERQGRKDIPHDDPTFGLVLDQKKSLLDDMLADCQAQYGEEKPEGGSKPQVAWSYCKTKLKDLDTTKLHFVRMPLNHIVIDFDLKNEKGEKDALLNLEAADKWPKTYAEYSQGGKGLHLHYVYDGDPTELESIYAPDIEIKVYTGKSSLRRRLSLCNNIPVATISCGLPKKEGGKNDMVDFDVIQNEQHLLNIISKCLHKKIAQPYTTPAMSLIKKTLDTAYESGISYDIRGELQNAIKAFAAKSSHQKEFCMKIANDLHYCSKNYEETTPATKVEPSKNATVNIQQVLEPELPKELKSSAKQLPITKAETKPITLPLDGPLVFFDIEVFPNLLLVNWKEQGKDGVARMINPSQRDILDLMKRKLVGFNCRRYDNHILYARAHGYSIPQIYKLSQDIINDVKRNCLFGNAFDISYTDVYDFAAKKQSLKKWEIELGIHHQELGLPWDKPVPEERWTEVAEYCDNDVIATEAVFNHLVGDFKARQILAEIAGMTVNDTTNQLTTRIIFGDDPNPQVQFNYPDLAKEFPGYRFENGKSFYRHKIFVDKKDDFETARNALKGLYGDRFIWFNDVERWVEVDEEIGEGGRVYAVPGIWCDLLTFDVASMHPHSIIAENGFGKYTDLFKQLLDIRIAIKHRDFDAAKQMLDGRLARYLNDPDEADALSQALKIAINSVYGLTAASFTNKFRDPRNKDNWVAKRGALFIETLRLKVTEMGGTVVHIKTDSIKVQKPSEKIKKFIMDYGKQWGYTFEIEDIYEKMCLVNDAVYIALRDKEDPGWLKECRKARKKADETGKPYQEPTRWSATGAQFAHPYVFKTLFSHEALKFEDLCETKSVTSALYLDFNENLSDVSDYEKDLEKLNKRIKVLIKDADGYSTLESWNTFYRFSKQAIGPRGRYDMKVKPEDAEKIFAEIEDLDKDRKVLEELIAAGHNYNFVGKAGSFCPVKAGYNGGILVREKDGKYSAATGSKGYRWREGESLVYADRMDMIDMGYFQNLAKTAREAIEKYGDFEEFASERAPSSLIRGMQAKVPLICDDAPEIPEGVIPKMTQKAKPWVAPCGDPNCANCQECPMFDITKIPPECRKGYNLTEYFVIHPEAAKVSG